DGDLEFGNFTFDVHRDLLGQVAVGHGRRDLGDVAHLGRKIAGHEIHAIGEVLPGAGHALDVGLAAEDAFRADLARDTRHFGGDGAELLYHGLDRVLQFRNFTLDVDGDFLGQIAVGHGLGHVGDVAHLAGQVAGHGVNIVGQILPGTGYALDVGLAAQLAFRAYLAGHSRDLGGEGAERIDHR